MSAETDIRFDAGNGIVYLAPRGEMSGDRFVDLLADVFVDPAFRKGMHLLWDLRRANPGGLRPADILRIHRFTQDNLAVRGEGCSALVVSSELGFALGRTLAAWREQAGPAMRLFSSVADAEAWLLETS
ncbi:MAG: hypothetical protein R3E86_22260 [Pseudomonadales bacterium]